MIEYHKWNRTKTTDHFHCIHHLGYQMICEHGWRNQNLFEIFIAGEYGLVKRLLTFEETGMWIEEISIG